MKAKLIEDYSTLKDDDQVLIVRNNQMIDQCVFRNSDKGDLLFGPRSGVVHFMEEIKKSEDKLAIMQM